MNTAIDIPYQLLSSSAKQVNQTALWLADESFPPALYTTLDQPSCWLLTNRFDTYTQAKKHEINAFFNDYDFSVLNTAAIEKVFYRVSKEKALVHYLINQAYQKLPIGGELYISGFKNDGIKSYIDKGKLLFGNGEVTGGSKQAKVARLIKSQTNNQPLDDKDYAQTQVIHKIGDLPVISKPGVFGWNKEDPGSQFLIEHLQDFLNLTEHSQTLLDLGCGYGYLSLQAFHKFERLQTSEFTLTDNNATALLCAKENIATHKIKGQVIADDCASQIEDCFDIILCNPPFHKGFDVSNDITTHFLSNISKRLQPHGKALIVVNQFVGVEKRAPAFFAGIKELARNKSFKLLVLSRPLRTP